jgi:hypothetical protein
MITYRGPWGSVRHRLLICPASPTTACSLHLSPSSNILLQLCNKYPNEEHDPHLTKIASFSALTAYVSHCLSRPPVHSGGGATRQRVMSLRFTTVRLAKWDLSMKSGV